MKIKICTLVSFITIIGYFVSQTEAVMEDKILEFLEDIRNRMCYPLFGFPALDPLQIEHCNFSMDNKYVVDFTGSITDFRAIGLSSFNVTNLKISKIPRIRSNFDIALPLICVESLYTARGSLARILYLNGNDKAKVHIEDVKLSISWIFKTGLAVGIRKLKIGISVGNLFVDIENLTEEDRVNEFVHALINEMGIELLNDIWLEAQDKGVTQYVEDIINKFLSNYTLSDIVKIIAAISGGELPLFGNVPADCKANVTQKIT